MCLYSCHGWWRPLVRGWMDEMGCAGDALQGSARPQERVAREKERQQLADLVSVLGFTLPNGYLCLLF